MKASFSHLLTKPKSFIFLSVFIVFLIGANIAWLNPRPDFCLKTNPKIPFMWQYNLDSGNEFLSAAFFPEIFKVRKTRINRPGYPFAANMIGKTIGIIPSHFYHIKKTEKAFVGYISLKLIVYLSGSLMFYSLLLHYFNKEVAVFSVLLLLFQPLSINYIASFHTTELQFFTPIFIVFMFHTLIKKNTILNTIIFSLIVGFLMLCKQNYAVYLAVITYCILKKEIFRSALSIIAHLVPLALWMFVLKLLQIPFYNTEFEEYRQGIWIIEEFIFYNPFQMIQTVVHSLHQFIISLADYFSVFFAFAIFSFVTFIKENKKSTGLLLFVFLMFFWVWVQFFATRRYIYYMVSDLSVIILPLASYQILKILEKYKDGIFPVLILSLTLFISCLSIVQFPWVHPYKHADSLQEKLPTEVMKYNQ
ncbi:MAG: hypothetical protein A2Y40_08500 [Candidatus Margulisbacteria bacterium GWF2_35_9]|nr:MAG: hypothetical protein A2Y40_08500 [Candidatus Margulisbacteria bacterium GWF2_35_9]